jgi:hypothetical protein
MRRLQLMAGERQGQTQPILSDLDFRGKKSRHFPLLSGRFQAGDPRHLQQARRGSA